LYLSNNCNKAISLTREIEDWKKEITLSILNVIRFDISNDVGEHDVGRMYYLERIETCELRVQNIEAELDGIYKSIKEYIDDMDNKNAVIFNLLYENKKASFK